MQRLLIDKPESTVDDLLKFVKGPDFPTGGCLWWCTDASGIYDWPWKCHDSCGC